MACNSEDITIEKNLINTAKMAVMGYLRLVPVEWLVEEIRKRKGEEDRRNIRQKVITWGNDMWEIDGILYKVTVVSDEMRIITKYDTVVENPKEN